MQKKNIFLIVLLVVVFFLIIGLSGLYIENVQLKGKIKEMAGQSETNCPGLFTGTPPEYTNSEKPYQSQPIKDEELTAKAKEYGVKPEEIIKIGVSATGFSPSKFEVKPSQKAVLAVKSTDQWVHVFKFEDSSLSEVALGLSAGEMRMITFQAPKSPGTYPFYCDVPGHKGRGEKGEMVVTNQ